MDAEGEGKLHLFIAVSSPRNFTTETMLLIFSPHSPFFFHFFLGSSAYVIVALVACVTNFTAYKIYKVDDSLR